jgi:hypothetical protein
VPKNVEKTLLINNQAAAVDKIIGNNSNRICFAGLNMFSNDSSAQLKP